MERDYDNATFAQPIGVGLVKTDASKHRIWAFNGGSAEYQTFGQGYPEYTPTNDFFVFNGGTRIIRTDASDWSHTNKIYTVFGYYPQIRVCEGGGGINLTRTTAGPMRFSRLRRKWNCMAAIWEDCTMSIWIRLS